jgi:hypothetical protein
LILGQDLLKTKKIKTNKQKHQDSLIKTDEFPVQITPQIPVQGTPGSRPQERVHRDKAF